MTGRRWPVVLIALVAVGVLVTAALQGTLTFYRTPSELASAAVGDRLRLGGSVVPGSVERADGVLRFRLTDGVRDIIVEQRTDLPGDIREGEQLVVEGVLDGQGILQADTVMSRHGNTYEPAAGADQPGIGVAP